MFTVEARCIQIRVQCTTCPKDRPANLPPYFDNETPSLNMKMLTVMHEK